MSQAEGVQANFRIKAPVQKFFQVSRLQESKRQIDLDLGHQGRGAYPH
jgi:hypothetical protein